MFLLTKKIDNQTYIMGGISYNSDVKMFLRTSGGVNITKDIYNEVDKLDIGDSMVYQDYTITRIPNSGQLGTVKILIADL